jgi:hypothetical protein
MELDHFGCGRGQRSRREVIAGLGATAVLSLLPAQGSGQSPAKLIDTQCRYPVPGFV